MLVPLEELSQPPSGGCVLKRNMCLLLRTRSGQPPSGGCVLKRNMCLLLRTRSGQPPSGGCVLKPSLQSGLI